MGVFTNTIHKFAPSWFVNGPNMRKLLAAFAGGLDDMHARVFAGMRNANPYAAGARTSDGTLLQCDADVLPWHARDRGIRLYSSEPELSQRIRLSQWRQLKKRRGSHQGELRNIHPFWQASAASTLPTMRIVHQSNEGTPTATWHTLSPDGSYSVHRQSPSNWNYDDTPSKRTEFSLIIFLPEGYSTAPVYDGVELYDGGAIYDGVTTLAINDLVAAVKEAKAAHSRLRSIIATTLTPTTPIDSLTDFPFDPTATAITFPDGSTSLPVGNWAAAVDPVTNLPTRPWWMSVIYEDTSA